MRTKAVLSIFLLALPGLALAGDKKSSSPRPISRETRFQLIRLMNAEFAWAKKPFPLGEQGLVIKPDGQVSPDGDALEALVMKRGEAAKPGQRVQITKIEIKGNQIKMEINGGGVRKKKWYERIEVSGGGGGSVRAGPGENPLAAGSYLTVEFRDHVPEMTAGELQKILAPVLDFSVKSAAQAYTETLPENVRHAIRDHKVLVGMSKEMVLYAKGRPPKRLRERDTDGTEYEEWIFGQPPEDVEFVRFVGEEVVQLKVMKITGERVVKTEREVDVKPSGAGSAVSAAEAAPEPAPAKAPSLRRPGDPAPPAPDKVPAQSGPPRLPDPDGPHRVRPAEGGGR
jgi:hypothetical protein